MKPGFQPWFTQTLLNKKGLLVCPSSFSLEIPSAQRKRELELESHSPMAIIPILVCRAPSLNLNVSIKSPFVLPFHYHFILGLISIKKGISPLRIKKQ